MSGVTLRLALPGKQHERIPIGVFPFNAREQEANHHVFARIQHAVAREQTKIGIAAARRAAGVEQPSILGQSGNDDDQIRIDDRRSDVCDPVGIAFARAVEGRDHRLCGDIQELGGAAR